MPLVKLGKEHPSHTLRSALIRMAASTSDKVLKKTLVQILTASQIPETVLSWSEYSTLLRIACSTKDENRRAKISALLKNAKYTPVFLKWVETQSFPNPETGEQGKFYALPPDRQQEIYKKWKEHRKTFLEKLKPAVLSDETILTPEKYDLLKRGDMLWMSWSPSKLHRVEVVGKNKSGKPFLELVQIDINDPSKEGAKRYLHRSSAGDPEHEIHIVPSESEELGPEPFVDEQWDATPPEEPSEPVEPPFVSSGKHKDRVTLQGLSRSHDDHKINPPEELISLSTSGSMEPELAEATRARFGEMTVSNARALLALLAQALENPSSQRMQNYLGAGYDEQGIRSLHDGLRSHMGAHEGHRYVQSVLDIANKYDLEGEDADELRIFRHSSNDPFGITKPEARLPEPQIREKFLATAKPETRERMKVVPLADFMTLYRSITDEDPGVP